MMTSTEILDKALLLPDHERARIAEQLIITLDEAAEPRHEVELAWQEEVERRLNQIDNGEVQCIAWEEVRERLRGKYVAKG